MGQAQASTSWIVRAPARIPMPSRKQPMLTYFSSQIRFRHTRSSSVGSRKRTIPTGMATFISTGSTIKSQGGSAAT